MEKIAEDVKRVAESSVAQDVNSQDSSPEQQQEDVNNTEETEQVTEQSDGDEGSSPETGDTEQEADDQQDSQQPPEEEVVEEEEEQVTEEPTIVDKPGDEKLPFGKHARWKEVIEEKNTYKRQTEELKPVADQARALNDFLAQNQIPQQEFQAALNYLRALRANPQEAYAMLKPTYKQLAALVGEDLSPELQADVASGTLSVERAQQITKAEAQQRYQQWRQSQQQQNQAAGAATLVQQTIGMWAQTKVTSDPDFKEGTPLWSLVDKNLRAMPVFQTPQEAQAGAERAYKEAKDFLKQFQPRTAPPLRKRPPQSQAASHNSRQVISSSDDVVKLMIANGGRAPANIRYKV